MGSSARLWVGNGIGRVVRMELRWKSHQYGRKGSLLERMYRGAVLRRWHICRESQRKHRLVDYVD